MERKKAQGPAATRAAFLVRRLIRAAYYSVNPEYPKMLWSGEMYLLCAAILKAAEISPRKVLLNIPAVVPGVARDSTEYLFIWKP